jgi:hypothetical protein
MIRLSKAEDKKKTAKRVELKTVYKLFTTGGSSGFPNSLYSTPLDSPLRDDADDQDLTNEHLSRLFPSIEFVRSSRSRRAGRRKSLLVTVSEQ